MLNFALRLSQVGSVFVLLFHKVGHGNIFREPEFECLDVSSGVRLQGKFFKSTADSVIIYFCCCVRTPTFTHAILDPINPIVVLDTQLKIRKKPLVLQDQLNISSSGIGFREFSKAAGSGSSGS